MSERYYLRIKEDTFGFVVEGLHDITKNDIKITQKEYEKFFELQSQGKQFRLKEKVTGTGLFDFVEEYVPEPIIDSTPTLEDRLAALETMILSMNKAEVLK